MDAILHQHKFDVRHFEAGFLGDFAAQGVFGRLAPFDFAAGNAPEIRPFVRANHQDLARVVENQRPDRGERRMGGFKIGSRPA